MGWHTVKDRPQEVVCCEDVQAWFFTKNKKFGEINAAQTGEQDRKKYDTKQHAIHVHMNSRYETSSTEEGAAVGA